MSQHPLYEPNVWTIIRNYFVRIPPFLREFEESLNTMGIASEFIRVSESDSEVSYAIYIDQDISQATLRELLLEAFQNRQNDDTRLVMISIFHDGVMLTEMHFQEDYYIQF